MLNLDTHILLFALEGTLSAQEQRLLSENSWSISAIVLWEICKLVKLGRIEMDMEDAETYRTLSRIHTWPLTLDICQRSQQLDFQGDPADEIIAATSVVHNVPLLTRDKMIRRSKLVPFAKSSVRVK